MVLADILSSLRLSGGVIIDGRLSGDFCLNAQFTPEECAPFFPMPETLIGYHYVRSGHALAHASGEPTVELKAGDIVILPRNDPHVLESRRGLRPASPSEISWTTDDGVHHIACGTDGPATRIWCGFLGTSKQIAHPILDALPALLRLETRNREKEWLDSSLRFLAEDQPQPHVVARLAEVFLAQAIQDYVEQLPADSTGWLAGLRDPAVAKALSIIHTRYSDELDVETLAREAGVSRSILCERFGKLIGEPPMRYCARWRMRVAANLLRDGKDNTANIAYSVGFNSEAAFNRAFKREYGEPPASWRRSRQREDEKKIRASNRGPLPPQTVQYCTAVDGARLAYSIVGDGPVLVKAANWLNHLEFEWDSPVWRHWIAALARDHSLLRYDGRGNGLSDWEVEDLSFEAMVSDLQAVVEDAGVDRFDLLGISQGCAVGIAYAVRHPGRVRRMVLYGGYALGWAKRSDKAEVVRREAMITLTEMGWGQDNPAYRQMFTSFYCPGATGPERSWFNELQRISTSPRGAERLQRCLSEIDVRKLLDKVNVPTLVLHGREDAVVPFDAGRGMAEKIPGARFVALDSANHLPLESEPAWPVLIEEIRAFLSK